MSRGRPGAHGAVPVLLLLHALLPRVSARRPPSAQPPVRAGHHPHPAELPGLSDSATPAGLRPGLPVRTSRQSRCRLPLTPPQRVPRTVQHFVFFSI